MHIQIEQLCESDVLSIESLQRIIDEDIIDMEDIKNSSFFHRACYNKHISLDIVNFLFDIYPEAAEIKAEHYCPHPAEKTTSYPLHLACLNNHCNNDIVVAILKRHPDAVLHMCMIGRELQIGDYYSNHSFVKGSPLHYYLSRTSNVDLNVVKVLVEANPDCLRVADDEACFAPIHVLCCNPGVNDLLDVLKFLIEKDPESLQIDGGYCQVPFLMACANTNATLSLVKLLYDFWPEAIHKQDSCGDYPMHQLSMNRELNDQASEDIFHFLLQNNYGALSETDHGGDLPIHLAVRYKSPINFVSY
jgi:ankyrin repeat protein